jgi:hypothetical protein
LKKISKVALFLELAKPDETGNSRKVLVSLLVNTNACSSAMVVIGAERTATLQKSL